MKTNNLTLINHIISIDCPFNIYFYKPVKSASKLITISKQIAVEMFLSYKLLIL